MEIQDAVEVLGSLVDSGGNATQMAKASGVEIPKAIEKVVEAKKAVRNLVYEDESLAPKIMEVLARGLEADKPIVLKGGIEFVPDWNARYKFWAAVCVMKGWMKDGQSVSNNQLNIIIKSKADTIKQAPIEATDAEVSQ